MPTTVDGTTGITFPDNTVQTTAATSAFPSGTVLLFYQAAAPTGWTQVTTQNNKALRVVSGTGGVAGGSVAFTTAFTSQTVAGTVGATTLSTSQIPSHTHSFPTSATTSQGGANVPIAIYQQSSSKTTDATGGGGSHDHTFTGTAINLAVQYIDVILASKN